jgi:hypothetical protein
MQRNCGPDDRDRGDHIEERPQDTKVSAEPVAM